MSGEPVHSVPLPAAPDPNLAQRKASAPDDIVWVGASAGSGKTTVLTNRVLRLLLPDPEGRYPGAAPHKLLCITYTKAAAAEMALRVQKSLGQWAVMPEGELFNALSRLTGHDPDAAMLAAARKLFADVLECPGGLKLMTIHSFCQSVLGRFPLEAGINPDFTVLDDAQAQDLFTLALEDVLLRSQEDGQDDLVAAFRLLSQAQSLDDLRGNIRAVLRHPDRLEAEAPAQQGMAAIAARIKIAFGMPDKATPVSLGAAFIAQTPQAELRAAATLLINGAKTLQAIGYGMLDWLGLPDAQKPMHLPAYRFALFTTADTPRKLGKFADEEPAAAKLLQAECERLDAYEGQVRLLRQADATAALLVLARAVWRDYDARKRRLGALDYDDLIRRTDDLLRATSGKWVHYKLDGGIDHILMDEAQDTNPRQWDIMKNISAEIFAGTGRDSERPRTVFVVGDEKQSIFSFQGADPASFERMRAYFETQSAAAERSFARVPLEVSFRTTPPVLKLVDTVFADPEQRARIGLGATQELRHYSRREKDAGLVELWPLQPKPAKADRGQWELPFTTAPTGAGGTAALAEQVAQEIWGWLQKKEILPSQGRPVRPGDILILVRNRTGLVGDLIRQLKRRGLPVSGIDRLVLGDQIGVQDLLALARFARLPSDDFSLACVLRSPLVGLGEDALMDLSLERAPQTLWQRVRERAAPEMTAWLEDMIHRARSAAPFEFFEAALIRPCPADPQGTGWRAMTARLGEDVIDPLEELASLCLRLEEQGLRTLESLILWQQKTRVEIKREMEEAGGLIRIMTVHASKGLEAPIVILPDTTAVPERGKTDRFLWPDRTGLPAPLWAGNTDGESPAYARARDRLLDEQFAEYSRLLYVALTRARDRLYIMGMEPPAKRHPLTWYGLVEAAFARLGTVETLANGRKRLVSEQLAPVRDKPTTAAIEALPAPPPWLETIPAAEAPLPMTYAPSKGDILPAQSPLDPANPYRFRRGIVTHKLLQILPDLPEASRAAAARRYVERSGADLPPEIRTSIVNETLTVLNDPAFAAVFGPGSLAEVPVTGKLADGRLISGQIDRLLIRRTNGGGEILIVDYKTNRPSPKDASDVPQAYRDQLRGYRDALAQIYPNYLINCALLWTDQPLLMPVAI